MSGTAIRVSGLSKRYNVFDGPRSRLMHAIFPKRANGAHTVCALNDVSFEVERGESMAIIGRNGGGKSTLLQILAGTLPASSGEVVVNGRISALLELGSGFNPEYTGRDNVVMNGLVLGLQRTEILRRFDEIAAFADIGEAIERPVSTYSSGMVVRLAFAVQVLTDPEILIVDEALSVGDFFFQQKCFAYIRSLIERGVTLLFVSHDMRTVRDLCTRAIYLRGGNAMFVGDAQTAIRMYLHDGDAGSAADSGTPELASQVASHALVPASVMWRRPGSGRLLAVDIVDRDGASVSRALMGETVRVHVYFRARADEAGHLSLELKNRYDQLVTSVGSYLHGMPALSSGDADFAIFTFELDLMLEAGAYSLKVGFVRPTGRNQGELLEESGWLGPFTVEWNYEQQTAPFLGMFGIPVRCQLGMGDER
jgi:lipopolysaccharide transport system ATP-binding protein